MPYHHVQRPDLDKVVAELEANGERIVAAVPGSTLMTVDLFTEFSTMARVHHRLAESTGVLTPRVDGDLIGRGGEA